MKGIDCVKLRKFITLLLALVMAFTFIVPVSAAERSAFVLTDDIVLDESDIMTFANGHQAIRLLEREVEARGLANRSVIEVNVNSPVLEMIGLEVDLDVEQVAEILFDVTSSYGRQIMAARSDGITFAQDANVVAAHQARIDEIISMVNEHGVKSLQDLATVLESSQIENSSDNTLDSQCHLGICWVVPVWIVIGNVWIAGYQCIFCGRLFV
jgi:hypothetical protein